jgi:hypothetical protein
MFKACGAGYSPLSPDIGDRLNAATGAAGRLLPIMVILGSKIPTAAAGPLCQLVDGLPRGNWRLGRSVLPPYALECRWNGLRRGGTAVPETFAGDCLRLWRVGTRAEYDACCSGGDGCPELGGACAADFYGRLRPRYPAYRWQRVYFTGMPTRCRCIAGRLPRRGVGCWCRC